MGDQVKLTWAEYVAQFPPPYDLGVPGSVPYDEEYDRKRKANLKWQAEFYTKGYSADSAGSVQLLNPFIAGGWFYGVNGAEYIPSPTPAIEIDWAAEAAAGRPVIGPVVPASVTVVPPKQSLWKRVKRVFAG